MVINVEKMDEKGKRIRCDALRAISRVFTFAYSF